MAENGQQAIDAFKENTDRCFDFVLMDIGMPVLNGIEAATLIREHERDHNLTPSRIIALTAWADTKIQTRAMAAGMDVFLPKPVEFNKLRKMVDDLSKQGE